MLTDDGELWYRINSRRLGYGLIVPPDDMIHLKNMSLDGYVGASPIALAQDIVGLALATQQHGGILFRQGGQIGGVVSHPGKLSKEASERVANSWRETHAGVQNAHKVAILEEGMTFNKVAITNEEAQFLETRRFQVQEIARLYGVPPHRLGELDKATLNNIEQQNQQYVDSALKPIANAIEQLFDHHLLFDDERSFLECKFDFDDMTRGDMKTRFEAYQIGTLNGWLNRNEVRARENMNPIEDGHGDEYRVPLNTAVPSDNLAQTTTAPSVTDDAPGRTRPRRNLERPTMQIISATQFKTLNRGRNVTRSAIAVRKQMIAPAEAMGGELRALRFTISTESVDREQDSDLDRRMGSGELQAQPRRALGPRRRAIADRTRLRCRDRGRRAESVDRIHPARHARGRRLRRVRVSPRPRRFHRRDLGRLPPAEVGLHARRIARSRRLVSGDRLPGTGTWSSFPLSPCPRTRRR